MTEIQIEEAIADLLTQKIPNIGARRALTAYVHPLTTGLLNDKKVELILYGSKTWKLDQGILRNGPRLIWDAVDRLIAVGVILNPKQTHILLSKLAGEYQTSGDDFECGLASRVAVMFGLLRGLQILDREKVVESSIESELPYIFEALLLHKEFLEIPKILEGELTNLLVSFLRPVHRKQTARAIMKDLIKGLSIFKEEDEDLWGAGTRPFADEFSRKVFSRVTPLERASFVVETEGEEFEPLEK